MENQSNTREQGLSNKYYLLAYNFFMLASITCLALPFFLWPYAVFAVGATGFADAWLDIRRRLGASA